jgi:hypothetical protein
MRPLIPLLTLTLALPGCASAPATPAQNDNDCAVIAAVAKEHYRVTEHTPPPLWLDASDDGWAPTCDWSRYGVSFPEIYREGGPRWLQFKRPRYDGQVATIEAGILHGPLAGMGVQCRLRSGVAGWAVERCDNTWIS